ncbi:hypothetical protein LMH73_009390 [Vibrio splendidus]|nr:hypothetical protein [Vibrio splendidus]MCC4881871.1 hypothetical protein [Vibrio splendidus]
MTQSTVATPTKKFGTAQITPNGFVIYFDNNGVRGEKCFYHPKHYDEIARDYDVVFV